MILIELYSVNNFQSNMDKYLDLITDYLGELKTLLICDKNQISKALDRLCKALEDERISLFSATAAALLLHLISKRF